MGLDKAIKYKKEKRKVYRKAKAVDRSCRNHGSCLWCLSNRMHKHKKRLIDDPAFLSADLQKGMA